MENLVFNKSISDHLRRSRYKGREFSISIYEDDSFRRFEGETFRVQFDSDPEVKAIIHIHPDIPETVSIFDLLPKNVLDYSGHFLNTENLIGTKTIPIPSSKDLLKIATYPSRVYFIKQGKIALAFKAGPNFPLLSRSSDNEAIANFIAYKKMGEDLDKAQTHSTSKVMLIKTELANLQEKFDIQFYVGFETSKFETFLPLDLGTTGKSIYDEL